MGAGWGRVGGDSYTYQLMLREKPLIANYNKRGYQVFSFLILSKAYNGVMLSFSTYGKSECL